MRFAFWSLAVCFAIFGVTQLTGCNKDADDDDANENTVTVDKVPAAAIATIKKEIGDAPIKRVLSGKKKGHTYYEAKYNDPSGKRMMVQVQDDGKLLKKEDDDDPEPK
jgi:hypothetical protein